MAEWRLNYGDTAAQTGTGIALKTPPISNGRRRAALTSNARATSRAFGLLLLLLCRLLLSGLLDRLALNFPFKPRRIALAGAVALTAIFKFQGSAALGQSPARQILNHNLWKENHAIFGHSVSP